MTKFLLVYHGGSVPENEAAQTAAMDAWTKWFTSIGAATLDPGNPTGQVQMVDGKGVAATVSNPVTGYSLIEANDMNAAVSMAKACPIIADGGAVQVAETLVM